MQQLVMGCDEKLMSSAADVPTDIFISQIIKHSTN